MGAPTVFTEEVIAKLCYAIELGATYNIACGYAGISYEVFAKWQRAGKKGEDEKFVNFIRRIKNAKDAGAVKWLSKIDEAKEWTAFAWKLERRYYKDYCSNPMVRTEIKQLAEKLHRLELAYGVAKDGKETEKNVDQRSSGETSRSTS